MEAQTHEPQMGLTFEKVWAMFQETDRKMQETDRKMQETDRRMRETDRKMQETDREMQETGWLIRESQRETDRALKEASRIVGNLGNKFGGSFMSAVCNNTTQCQTVHKYNLHKNTLKSKVFFDMM
jgi:hypothetical protein